MQEIRNFVEFNICPKPAKKTNSRDRFKKLNYFEMMLMRFEMSDELQFRFSKSQNNGVRKFLVLNGLFRELETLKRKS